MKITRRDAMKSLASALCLSQVRLLIPEQPTAIPWEFFCDRTEWSGRRFAISEPFVQFGKQFATDARWLIRAESSDGPTGEERRLPNAESAFQHFVSGEYTAFGDLSRCRKLLGKTPCTTCLGQEIIGPACPVCDGSAKDEHPSYGKLCQCKGTGLGEGGKLCDACGGKGVVVGWRVLQVPGGNCFDLARIAEIARVLPEIDWRMPCRSGPTKLLGGINDPSWPLHFRSRALGLEGLLCPLDAASVMREEAIMRSQMARGELVI